MLSHQKLQNTLDEMKEITKMDMLLFNSKGKEVAATADAEVQLETVVQDFCHSMADQQTFQQYQFFKIVIENDTEYVLILQETGEIAYTIGRMAVCQIRNLVMSSVEQFDRNNFIQNVLLGNMLIVDIFAKARKLHIDLGSDYCSGQRLLCGSAAPAEAP